MSTPTTDWKLNNQSFIVLLERIIGCSNLSKKSYKKFEKNFSNSSDVLSNQEIRVCINSSIVFNSSLDEVIRLGGLTDIFTNQIRDEFSKINQQQFLFKTGIVHNQSRFSSFGNVSKNRLESTLGDLHRFLERKFQNPAMNIDLPNMQLDELLEIIQENMGWRIGVNNFDYVISHDSWNNITFDKCSFLNNNTICGFDEDPDVSGVGRHSLLSHTNFNNIPKSNVNSYRMVTPTTTRRWQQFCFRQLAFLLKDVQREKIKNKLKDAAHIDSCIFDQCLFENLNLERMIIRDTIFNGCKFRNVGIEHVIFDNCKLINCSFQGELVEVDNGRKTIDKRCSMKWCSFIDSDLTGTSFATIGIFEHAYDMNCSNESTSSSSDGSIFMPIYVTNALMKAPTDKKKIQSRLLGSDSPPYAWHEHSSYAILQGLFHGSDFTNLLAMMAVAGDTW